jgi:hypothetical protein
MSRRFSRQGIEAGTAGKSGPATTSDIYDGLYTIKHDNLGGMAPPLTFKEGSRTQWTAGTGSGSTTTSSRHRMDWLPTASPRPRRLTDFAQLRGSGRLLDAPIRPGTLRGSDRPRTHGALRPAERNVEGEVR